MIQRCLCGLAVKHHFKRQGNTLRKLDCWQAAARHQRASVRRTTFAALLKKCLEARR